MKKALVGSLVVAGLMLGSGQAMAWCYPIPAPACTVAHLKTESMPSVWWDPDKSGQGLTVIRTGGTDKCPELWGFYTAYDKYGSATWYLFTGNGCYVMNLYKFSGPPVGGIWDPQAVQSEVDGSVLLYLEHDGNDAPTQECNADTPCSINGIYAAIRIGPPGGGQYTVEINLVPFAPKQAPKPTPSVPGNSPGK